MRAQSVILAAQLLSQEAAPVGIVISDYVGPILSTGLVGVFLVMLMLRIKIMPVWVYDDAKIEWARERADLQADIADLKTAVKEGSAVYTTQVIPVLTRVFEAEKELVDIRRAEQYRVKVPPNDYSVTDGERERREAYERGLREGKSA